MRGESVERVAAELSARNVINGIAHLVDSGDLKDLSSLVSNDAIFDVLGNKRVGLAEIVRGMEQRRAAGEAGPGSGARHTITTTSVSWPSGETVEEGGNVLNAVSYCVFLGGASSDNPLLSGFGVYHDTLEYTPAGWRLTKRVITGE